MADTTRLLVADAFSPPFVMVLGRIVELSYGEDGDCWLTDELGVETVPDPISINPAVVAAVSGSPWQQPWTGLCPSCGGKAVFREVGQAQRSVRVPRGLGGGAGGQGDQGGDALVPFKLLVVPGYTAEYARLIACAKDVLPVVHAVEGTTCAHGFWFEREVVRAPGESIVVFVDLFDGQRGSAGDYYEWMQDLRSLGRSLALNSSQATPATAGEPPPTACAPRACTLRTGSIVPRHPPRGSTAPPSRRTRAPTSGCLRPRERGPWSPPHAAHRRARAARAVEGGHPPSVLPVRDRAPADPDLLHGGRGQRS